jgi:hypothetical protein
MIAIGYRRKTVSPLRSGGLSVNSKGVRDRRI